MADLQVIEIFDSLQGEGYWAGTPMTFIRLSGCNAPELDLGCVRWCDTPGSWEAGEGESLPPRVIVARVHFPHLCVTGGEPLLQGEGVAELVEEAHGCGIRVHLETNGTVAPPRAGGESVFDWVVVSPKPPAYTVAPEWAGLVDELKLVVDQSMDTTTAERLAGEHPEAVVSIQPLWQDGQKDRAGRTASQTRAVRMVMEHPGWRLSLQTHKFLGIR